MWWNNNFMSSMADLAILDQVITLTSLYFSTYAKDSYIPPRALFAFMFWSVKSLLYSTQMPCLGRWISYSDLGRGGGKYRFTSAGGSWYSQDKHQRNGRKHNSKMQQPECIYSKPSPSRSPEHKVYEWMTIPRRTHSCDLRKRANEIEVEFREENPENSKDEHNHGKNIDTPECSHTKITKIRRPEKEGTTKTGKGSSIRARWE